VTTDTQATRSADIAFAAMVARVAAPEPGAAFGEPPPRVGADATTPFVPGPRRHRIRRGR
jgi:hypothetical protein